MSGIPRELRCSPRSGIRAFFVREASNAIKFELQFLPTQFDEMHVIVTQIVTFDCKFERSHVSSGTKRKKSLATTKDLIEILTITIQYKTFSAHGTSAPEPNSVRHLTFELGMVFGLALNYTRGNNRSPATLLLES